MIRMQKDKIISYVFVTLMLLSLLPIIYLGRYNHPTGDDYYYGGATKAVWEKTGSIVETVEEAIRGVAYQYENWQGTYSGMFLMHLSPNVFDEQAYKVGTLFILLLLVGSIFYLLEAVICRLLKGSKELWLITASIVATLWIQTVPSQGEAFFWFNGALYYTGYFSVTLIYIGVILRYLDDLKWYRIPVMILLAIFLAGGNYVSLLLAILLTVTITAILAVQKKQQGWIVGMIAVVLLVFLGISAAAPGNAVRQDGMWKIPAWKAVAKSLLQGVNYFLAWAKGWWLLALLVVTPFFWKSYEKVQLRFRYPLLIVGFTYGIFCAMSCPTFYTMNSTGPARVVAIVYYGFILFSFFSYFYILGWFYHWIKQKEMNVTWEKVRTMFEKPISKWILGLFALLLFVTGVKTATTVKAIQILASGEAKAYEEEYQERLKVLEDDSIKDVVFSSYKNQPDMLYVGDFSSDPNEMSNQKAAEYFGKSSLKINYEE